MTPFDRLAPTWAQRLIVQFNLTLEQACGLLGNLGYESGGFKQLQELKPAILGSKGGAGVAQWTGPRRVAFEKYAAVHNLSTSSEEANIGFLIEELSTTYKGTINQLKTKKTLADAVFSVGQTYERPGGTTPDHLPGFADRLVWAQRAYDAAKAMAVVVAVLPETDLAGPKVGLVKPKPKRKPSKFDETIAEAERLNEEELKKHR